MKLVKFHWKSKKCLWIPSKKLWRKGIRSKNFRFLRKHIYLTENFLNFVGNAITLNLKAVIKWRKIDNNSWAISTNSKRKNNRKFEENTVFQSKLLTQKYLNLPISVRQHLEFLSIVLVKMKFSLEIIYFYLFGLLSPMIYSGVLFTKPKKILWTFGQLVKFRLKSK